MATFSLLQESLTAKISREALEEASTGVRSVARADCARMSRDLFGIVVSGLPLDEANAFQAALKSHGFATHVVADAEIPLLHEAFTIQRIALAENALIITDAMGRETHRPLDELVFLAGGFLTREKVASKLVLQAPDAWERDSFPVPRHESRRVTEDFSEFRLDFFFSTAMHRLRATVSTEAMMFFRDRPVRPRDTALLLGAMMDLRELLPPDRISEGLKQPDTKTYYPSLQSYEEEIRWHFHGFKSGRG
ncbi:MAG: hypothetical protein V4640_13270 [Verrucomicrobiota bacterium]